MTGQWAGTVAVGIVVAVSAVVGLVGRAHKARRARVTARDLAGARHIGELRSVGFKAVGVDDDEWTRFATDHGMHRLHTPDQVERLVDDALIGDDGDGLDTEWWRL
ncbi:hypothetical protein [Microbispora sp. ATCC PTA-5024]|uniref:hypothetical protein n=1 Tax=Microbispora sp. ATCC PTA-5024 TaxID=316330 RepID=UPI0003DD2E47|nr:hypothetical protein [Microbispora sp. ATCC PTA-5024]ETK36168.1 hypothetical protein MPTA5024_11115 [Microbispora sp. ATCC PTA-5024]